jgi:hypothetical protein
MITIELNHIHPVDKNRFFASFNFKTPTIGGMRTYGYDGEWFFVGGGSCQYQIDEVGCNANNFHNPNRTQLAIDYIFTHKRLPIANYKELTVGEIEKALLLALRDHKIDKILI